MIARSPTRGQGSGQVLVWASDTNTSTPQAAKATVSRTPLRLLPTPHRHVGQVSLRIPGVAVHTHAEAFARSAPSPPRPAMLLDDGGSTLALRSHCWREVAACLQPWRTSERAHPGVIGHTRRVTALLAEIAPLHGEPVDTRGLATTT